MSDSKGWVGTIYDTPSFDGSAGILGRVFYATNFVMCTPNQIGKMVYFPSEALDQIQVGFGEVDNEQRIAPHSHLPSNRVFTDSPTILVILEGILEIAVYNPQRVFVHRFFLEPHDVFVQYTGGRSLRNPTAKELGKDRAKFIEVKLGPYLPDQDKVRFTEGESS